MSYTVSMLNSIAECDALLSLVAKEKSDLEFKKVTLTRHRTEMNETGLEVDQELAAVTAEVTAYQTIIATLPDGPTKDAQVTKLKRAELRLRTLTKKDQNYGVNAMLMLELDIARTDKEIEEINIFISEITAKKATL